uniref:Uncharacterized protein LOC102802374 n=1 Tax=Saccoglossus kowalevskii TaxID=10224 RepID=A0ABM0MZH6_SACKO
MGECLKLDQPKRKLSGIKDEEKTSSLENKTAKVLYPVDLLLTDRDNDSNGRRNEYYDSICSVDKDDVETRQCQYCNTQIQLSSYNVLRSLIFTDVFGEDSHGTLLLKCWNCKEIKNRTIAIYLNGQWWETEDILKSATHRKDGWSK